MLRLNAIPTTREAMCDTHVLGHPVQKGTQVFFFFAPLGPLLQSAAYQPATGALDASHHRGDDEETRPNLARFEPRRWLVRKKGGKEGEGLLAEDVDFDGTAEPRLGYGMGPRACWGRRIAWIEIRIFVAMLVWTFGLQKCPPALSTYAAHEALARVPDPCYLKLQKL